MPAGRKRAVSKRAIKKSVVKRAARPKAAALSRKEAPPKKASSKITTPKKPPPKKPRAPITREHPENLRVAEDDAAAIESVAKAIAKSAMPHRASNIRSAVARLDDPPTATPAITLAERVSNAIERELSKIEIIIGGGIRTPPARRSEAESRARVLASLARTLKEVIHLRRQEREESGQIARIADDDAIPRDVDTLRSELARRLDVLVGEAARMDSDAAQ